MVAKTVLPAQLKPGDVKITDSPDDMAAYGLAPRAGWSLAVIQRARKAKLFMLTPVEEVALYQALSHRPAVRKHIAEHTRGARKPAGGRQSAGTSEKADA